MSEVVVMQKLKLKDDCLKILDVTKDLFEEEYESINLNDAMDKLNLKNKPDIIKCIALYILFNVKDIPFQCSNFDFEYMKNKIFRFLQLTNNDEFVISLYSIPKIYTNTTEFFSYIEKEEYVYSDDFLLEIILSKEVKKSLYKKSKLTLDCIEVLDLFENNIHFEFLYFLRLISKKAVEIQTCDSFIFFSDFVENFIKLKDEFVTRITVLEIIKKCPKSSFNIEDKLIKLSELDIKTNLFEMLDTALKFISSTPNHISEMEDFTLLIKKTNRCNYFSIEDLLEKLVSKKQLSKLFKTYLNIDTFIKFQSMNISVKTKQNQICERVNCLLKDLDGVSDIMEIISDYIFFMEEFSVQIDGIYSIFEKFLSQTLSSLQSIEFVNSYRIIFHSIMYVAESFSSSCIYDECFTLIQNSETIKIITDFINVFFLQDEFKNKLPICFIEDRKYMSILSLFTRFFEINKLEMSLQELIDYCIINAEFPTFLNLESRNYKYYLSSSIIQNIYNELSLFFDDFIEITLYNELNFKYLDNIKEREINTYYLSLYLPDEMKDEILNSINSIFSSISNLNQYRKNFLLSLDLCTSLIEKNMNKKISKKNLKKLTVLLEECECVVSNFFGFLPDSRCSFVINNLSTNLSLNHTKIINIETLFDNIRKKSYGNFVDVNILADIIDLNSYYEDIQTYSKLDIIPIFKNIEEYKIVKLLTYINSINDVSKDNSHIFEMYKLILEISKEIINKNEKIK